MEIGALVNAVVRAAAPGSRDGERLALSLKLVVNVLRDHGARPDLVRELQSLAARNDRIVMVQPAGGAARLEVAGQHFVLSDSLRQALLAAGQTPSPSAGARAAAQNLASSTASAGAATGALGTPGAGSDALLRAAIALLPHAVAQGPDAARQRRRSADPGRAIALDLPALLAEDEPDAAQAGQQLQAAVRRSPLFLEAQAARATASGRALDGAGAAANLPPAERAALQLDALRRDAVAFAFNAWDRQPVQLDIAAEREVGDGAGDAATMAPVLPRRCECNCRSLALSRSACACCTIRWPPRSKATIRCGCSRRCRNSPNSCAAADCSRWRSLPSRPKMSPPPDAPRRRAAALAYSARDVAARAAPRVIAKGEQLLADAIIARAQAAGVPIHESRELVALLMQVDLDAHIPPALYVAVAEVLAWVYRLETRGGIAVASAAQPLLDNGVAVARDR